MCNSLKHLFAKHELAYSLFYTLSNKLLVVFLNLGSFLIIVRIYTEEDVGLWAVFLSITTILEVGRGALIRNALIRFINSENKEKYSSILSASLFINTVSALVISLILFMLIVLFKTVWDNTILSNMLAVYTVTMLVLTFFFHIEFILQAKANFHSVFYMYVIKQATFFLFLVGLVFLDKHTNNLIWLVEFQLTGVFISTLFAFLIAKQYLQFSRPEKFWIIKLWNYGKYTLATNLNSLIFRNTDHLMIAAFVSTTAVAYYNVAIRITNLLDLPSTAVAEAIFPKSVQISKSSTSAPIKKLYERSVGGVIAILTLPVLFIFFFSEETIRLIAGEQYLIACQILQIALIYALLLPFLKQFGMIMDSSGHPKPNTKLTILLSILNVILNYFLIQWMGLIGAAYATMITYLVGVIAALYILYGYFKVSFLKVLREIINAYLLLFNQIRFVSKKR